MCFIGIWIILHHQPEACDAWVYPGKTHTQGVVPYGNSLLQSTRVSRSFCVWPDLTSSNLTPGKCNLETKAWKFLTEWSNKKQLQYITHFHNNLCLHSLTMEEKLNNDSCTSPRLPTCSMTIRGIERAVAIIRGLKWTKNNECNFIGMDSVGVW